MGQELQFWFYLSNAIIIAWSAYRLLWGSRQFDSLTFFYFFSLFFFGVAPLIQYIQGLDLAPMYDEELVEFDYLRLNIVLIGVMLIFESVYRLTIQYFRICTETERNPKRHSLRSFFLILLLVVVTLTVFLLYQNFNLQNVFFRGGDAEGGQRNNDNKMVTLLCGMFLRYVPMSIATFYWMYGRSRIARGMLLAVGIFCCFPLGMARLQIAPVYLPFLMAAIPRLKRMRTFLISCFVGAILFLFPLLHSFREKDVDLSGFSFFDFSFLNQLHFDSFASFAYILKQNFITGPQQLLGSTFFWFPRSLWPDKPIESGRLLAETFDLGIENFTNIAVNFFAEGYLNFGYAGVFAFAICIAMICAVADKKFWSSEKNFARPAVLYYFSWISILFFLLRGDMMSGVAFTMGLMAAHFVAEKVCVRKMS